MRYTACILLLTSILASCGGTGSTFLDDIVSSSEPIVMRVDPEAASVGDEIKIYGIGFSIEAPLNAVFIGGTSTYATSHEFTDGKNNGEFEYITAIVPEGTPEGENSIVVQIHDLTSNSDVKITINP